MNLNQKIVLCAGVLLLFWAILNPIWECQRRVEITNKFDKEGSGTKVYATQTHYEIRSLFYDAPDRRDEDHIDHSILGMELVAIILSSVGITIAFKNKKDPQRIEV
jgi:hypothetical protein